MRFNLQRTLAESTKQNKFENSCRPKETCLQRQKKNKLKNGRRANRKESKGNKTCKDNGKN